MQPHPHYQMPGSSAPHTSAAETHAVLQKKAGTALTPVLQKPITPFRAQLRVPLARSWAQLTGKA